MKLIFLPNFPYVMISRSKFDKELHEILAKRGLTINDFDIEKYLEDARAARKAASENLVKFDVKEGWQILCKKLPELKEVDIEDILAKNSGKP